MAIDKQKTLKLVEELAAIDLVNPPAPAAAGRPGVDGERRASEDVREFLRANGIACGDKCRGSDEWLVVHWRGARI